MDRISDTLQEVMRGWEQKTRRFSEACPELLLKKFLTKKEFGHIKFRYFKKGILTFSVGSSSWLYYFNLKKDELLAGLQKKSGLIKELRFYIGETE